MLYTTFTVKDKEYKARLSAKTCVELEKKLGANPLNAFIKVAQTNEVPQLDTLITILHASLQAYQHGMSMDDVYALYDDFVDEGNSLMELIPLILEIFKVSGFFKPEEEKNA